MPNTLSSRTLAPLSPLACSNSSPEDAFETFQNMKNAGVGQGSKDFYLRLARMYLKNGT